MQAGFGFLEAGSVRAKNTTNILIKNYADLCFGSMAFWFLGYGLAFGEGNGFIGYTHLFALDLLFQDYAMLFFQCTFAATCATIVSGAIAERCQFFAYFAYSIILTGWVYPPVSHWAWDGSGWLAETGFYKDFAGSGVVHLLGANCAIVGCYFIKPRRGRFTTKGEPIDMPGHSVPLAGLGGFILIFGFLAFNGGSQTSISNAGDGDVVGLAIVNTILGAATGGMTVLFVNKFALKQPWSFLMTLNGALAGMVALCAGCNFFEPWAALIVGGLGGLGFMVIHFSMLKMRLDDPLDAVAVHGGGGIVGLLCVPWFMYVGLAAGERGIFWDGHLSHPWLVLGYNLAGGIAISVWALFWSVILFGSLKYLAILRVGTEDEFKGMDLIKHGESAYPADAWVEYQYAKKKDSEAGLPANMMGNMGAKVSMSGKVETKDENSKDYNNPFEMMPMAGMLFKQTSQAFIGAAGANSSNTPDSNKEVHDNKAYN